MPRAVGCPSVEEVKRAITVRGLVRLHQTGEDDESLIAVLRWPRKTGNEFYVCATSLLMFDKNTGACVQSTNMTLDLASLRPASPKDFREYVAGRKKVDYGRTSRHIICGDD